MIAIQAWNTKAEKTQRTGGRMYFGKPLACNKGMQI
jgi:hypothetical protein